MTGAWVISQAVSVSVRILSLEAKKSVSWGGGYNGKYPSSLCVCLFCSLFVVNRPVIYFLQGGLLKI